jgi:ribose transport system permease protein
MPSFIATMAVQLIFSGVALIYTQSETITNLPAPFLYIGGGEIFIIPMPIIVSIVVILLTSFILRKTVFGRRLYAIGTNPKTAYVSGLPVKRTIFMLFVISGFFSAIGMPSLGQDLLLDVFAAVIIGGSSPLGGVGRISGTVFGAIFIALINNSLNLLGIPWYIITIVKGVLILIMVLVEARKTSKAQH